MTLGNIKMCDYSLVMKDVRKKIKILKLPETTALECSNIWRKIDAKNVLSVPTKKAYNFVGNPRNTINKKHYLVSLWFCLDKPHCH